MSKLLILTVLGIALLIVLAARDPQGTAHLVGAIVTIGAKLLDGIAKLLDGIATILDNLLGHQAH